MLLLYSLLVTAFTYYNADNISFGMFNIMTDYKDYCSIQSSQSCAFYITNGIARYQNMINYYTMQFMWSLWIYVFFYTFVTSLNKSIEHVLISKTSAISFTAVFLNDLLRMVRWDISHFVFAVIYNHNIKMPKGVFVFWRNVHFFIPLFIDWMIDRLCEVLHAHLLIFSNNIILVRFTEILEPILGTLGMRLVYTLDARPVYCRAPCTHTLHTYSHLPECFWNLEQNWRTLR